MLTVGQIESEPAPFGLQGLAGQAQKAGLGEQEAGCFQQF